MAAAAAPTVSPEDQLAWEAEQRPRAAATALLGGGLMIAGLAIGTVTGRHQPPAFLLDSLHNLERPGPIGREPSNRIEGLQYLSTHSGGVLASVMIAVGLLGVAVAVWFLGRCTAARRPLPRPAIPALLIGAVAIAASVVAVAITSQTFYDDVLGGARTVDAAGVGPAADNSIFAGFGLLGVVALPLGVILITLNAMRAGLLTQIMGMLGMFAGVATLVFFNPSQPLLPLWTIALVPLMMGRWLGGVPPAWVTGREEPWPTGAELRLQRMKARGQTLAEPDPVPVEERAARVHPSSKKRKRKRRG